MIRAHTLRAAGVSPIRARLCAAEDVEQTTLFQWAAVQAHALPELRLMFHIPNGGQRNAIVAGKLKAQGVRAGVPDICLPVPVGVWHGLWIEMKAMDGRVSPTQKNWIQDLKERQYRVEVCYGWMAAKDVILSYLRPPVIDSPGYV